MLSKKASLDAICVKSALCNRCGLHKSRTNSVFSRGSYDSKLVFVAEGPGKNEDRLGEPFVGRSGKLLDNMIKAMGYDRDDVYICNVVKCRPPDNRKPTYVEMSACLPFLEKQLDIIQPKVIVTFGATATEALLGSGEGITKRRGKWEKYKDIAVRPTFHPAACLYNPNLKSDVWEDLQEVMKLMEK